MTWQEFTALLVLATAMSFSPGPNTTLSTALAANGGLRHAMRFVVAVPVGWSLLLALCAAGVGALVVAVPALRWGIKALGVGYLLWLAWRLANSATLGSSVRIERQVGAADRDGLQGANRSDSPRYREDWQRGRPPESADAHGAAIRAELPLLCPFQQTPWSRLCRVTGGAPCKGVGESEAEPGGVQQFRPYGKTTGCGGSQWRCGFRGHRAPAKSQGL